MGAPGTPFSTVETAWTPATIEERCRVLRHTLLARGEPQVRLDRYAPGGEENALTDALGAAIRQYMLLAARVQLLDWQEEDEQRRADRALTASLANTPAPLRLSADAMAALAVAGVGAPAVHPKSFHALSWCEALDGALRDVTMKAAALEDAEVAAMEPLLRSLAVRVWLWILLHPGASVPFDESENAEPPEWTMAFTPDDILVVLRAHDAVHRERLQLIAAMFPRSEASAESRLTLSGFLGGPFAQEVNEKPSNVLHRWTLGEAFGQAVTAAESARAAREKAETSRGR